jgi:signal transduction histidine kinase
MTRERTADEIVRDQHRTIAELEDALAIAEAARHQAESAADARAGFLAKMSHELRTPLNAILGFSEVLKTELFGPHGNERYKDYSKIIHDSGAHLLCLVNDILDMAKLEAGKLEIDFAPVDICRVIIDCVRGVEPQARRANVCVSVVLHSGIGSLNGDARRLRQMLLNLLSNAIKFTPEGGEVRISAFRSGTSVFLSVSDTGIGMKEDDIPKVLEPFRQVDSQMGRRHAGTGLGLPLTKELAELHGGSLKIESAVDFGTTATIALPFAEERRRAA